MMRRLFALGLVALLLLQGQADAWLIPAPASTYTGPGDIQLFTVWYGMRAYSRAVAVSGAAKMMRIRNTSSGELCDVLIASNGGQGNTTSCTGTGSGQSVSSFCGGADCKVQTLYDQVAGNACGGSTCDLVQDTNGNQPTIKAADSYVAIFANASTEVLQSANNITPTTEKMTLIGAGNETAVTANTIRLVENFGSANRITVSSTSAAITGGSSGSQTITGGLKHYTAVVNGASVSGICSSTSSCSYTSSVTASTTAAAPIIGGRGAGATGYIYESGFIDNTAVSGSTAASLNSNSDTYWGF